MPMPSCEPTLSWFELPHAPACGTVLAHMDTLSDAQATMMAVNVPDGLADQVFRLLLLRNGPCVHAFVNRCPHFGVPLAARQDQLIQKPPHSLSCNVHYARFRWDDGLCVSGDCQGESLIALPVEVRADGTVCVAPATPP